tara:strand:- start:754 stop:2688 length:1935 start_codon:yes stop_codon:yes gene_type:complete
VPNKIGKVNIGERVLVPFGKKTVVGIVVKREKQVNKDKINYILKPIIDIIDDHPVVNPEIMKICTWASDYYEYPLGQVIFGALPSQLKQGVPIANVKIFENQHKKVAEEKLEISLNNEQNSIFKKILRNTDSFSTSLIHGVTGSGKTEVYVKLAQEAIRKKKQVLIIVPEINLTPQTITRFEMYIDENIKSYHSGHTLKEKMTTWLNVKNKKLDIVIGTRSSIFLPFKSLGLIIIDEEHDSSLKQQEKFRYHARDLSIMRAKSLNIPIVIGSATPSFESLHNTLLEKFKKYNLTKRYYKTDLPKITLVDLTKDLPQDGISKFLKEKITNTLSKKQQILLYIGRRGFSHALTCLECRWISKCKICESFMTYHKNQKLLKCHHCGNKQSISTNPGKCEKCSLVPVGFGTQRIEDKIKELFPDARVGRIDSDAISSLKKLRDFINRAKNNEVDILIGTQMIVKGHDFPNVSLVGIIDIDSGLFNLDFRGLERTAQLITQVAGRSGRKNEGGHVIIQTRTPKHPLLDILLSKGYENFAMKNLNDRKKANLPPYTHLCLVRMSSSKKITAFNFLDKIKCLFSEQKSIFFLGPADAPIPKKNNMYIHQLIVGSKNRTVLRKITQEIRQYIIKKKPYNIKWSIDVDPIDLY